MTTPASRRANPALPYICALVSVLLPGMMACRFGPVGAGHGKTEITYRAMEEGEIWFKNSVIQLRFDNEMYCRVFLKQEEQIRSINDIPIDPAIARPMHYIEVNGKLVKDFQVDYRNVGVSDLRTPVGTGKRLCLLGYAKTEEGDKIEKSLNVEFYEDYPDTAIISVAYRNFENNHAVLVTKLVNNFFRLDASRVDPGSPRYAFWSFQSLAGKEGGGAAQRLTSDYSQVLSTRTSSTDSGECLPFVDLWTKEMGLAFGDLSSHPAVQVLPIQVAPDHRVEMCVESHTPVQIPVNGTLQTPKTFLMVHTGDYVSAWRQFHEIRKKLG